MINKDGTDSRFDGEIEPEKKFQDYSPAEVKRMGPDNWFTKVRKEIIKANGEPSEDPINESFRLIRAAQQKSYRVTRDLDTEKKEKQLQEKEAEVELPPLTCDPEWLKDLSEIEQNVVRFFITNDLTPKQIADKLVKDYPEVNTNLVTALLRRDEVQTVINKVRDSSLNVDFWLAIRKGLRSNNPQILKLVSELGVIKNAGPTSSGCHCHDNGCPKAIDDPKLMQLLKELGDKLIDDEMNAAKGLL